MQTFAELLWIFYDPCWTFNEFLWTFGEPSMIKWTSNEAWNKPFLNVKFRNRKSICLHDISQKSTLIIYIETTNSFSWSINLFRSKERCSETILWTKVKSRCRNSDDVTLEAFFILIWIEHQDSILFKKYRLTMKKSSKSFSYLFKTCFWDSSRSLFAKSCAHLWPLLCVSFFVTMASASRLGWVISCRSGI